MHGIVARLAKSQLVRKQESRHTPARTVELPEKRQLKQQDIYIRKQEIRKQRLVPKMDIPVMSIAAIVVQNWNLEQ